MDDLKNKIPSNLTSDDFEKMKAAGFTSDDFEKMKAAGFTSDDLKKMKLSGLTSDDFVKMRSVGITSDDLIRMKAGFSYPVNVGERGEFALKKFALKIASLNLGVYLNEEDNETVARVESFHSIPQYWVLTRDAPKMIAHLVRHFIISNGPVRSESQTGKKNDLSKGVKLDHS